MLRSNRRNQKSKWIKKPNTKQKRISTVLNYQSKNCFSLYETYTDQNSEYEMNKIRFNSEEFEILFDLLKNENSIRVFGLYGDFYSCIRIAEEILKI